MEILNHLFSTVEYITAFW